MASSSSSSSAAVVPCLTLNNGKQMPTFGLGTWKSKSGEVTQAVKDAIDIGYRHIDCAHVYENEAEVGEALKTKMAEGVVKREDLFITSKLWNTFHRPDLVLPALKVTLSNLKLDYLDLYLIHWPMAFKEGGRNFPTDKSGHVEYSDVDYIDVWPEMEKAVNLGLVKSIGISNFNSKQIERLMKVAKITPVTNQIECHPYLTQVKLKDFCEERGIMITGYSPLGSPDRPWAMPDDPSLFEEPKIQNIAQKYGKSVAQVLIRYHVDRGIAVIPKSVNKKRLEENFDVFDFKLSHDDMVALNSFERNGRLCGLDSVQDHPHWGFKIEF